MGIIEMALSLFSCAYSGFHAAPPDGTIIDESCSSTCKVVWYENGTPTGRSATDQRYLVFQMEDFANQSLDDQINVNNIIIDAKRCLKSYNKDEYFSIVDSPHTKVVLVEDRSELILINPKFSTVHIGGQ